MTKEMRSALLTMSLLVIGLLAGLVAMQTTLWYSDQLNQEISQSRAQETELQFLRIGAHRLDDFLRAYEQSSTRSRKEQLLAEFKASGELLVTSLPDLKPLPNYNTEERALLPRLKRDLQDQEGLDERVIETPSTSQHNALEMLHTPAAEVLSSNVQHESDRMVTLLEKTISRDRKRIATIDSGERALLLGLIAVSVVTIIAEFRYQIAASKKMKKLQEQVEQYIEEMTKARDEAVRASSAKSMFIAKVSHEVRTPLSGVISTIELLLRKRLPSEERALAETVQRSADSLLSIVNDTLDISKMEAGKLALRIIPFDPRAIVQDCTRLMSASAEKKQVYCVSRIDEQLPPIVLGDPERLRQILLNLVGNAIKFTQRGGVTVPASVIEQTPHAVNLQFNVIDTGIGVSEEDLGRLFKPFGQIDSAGVTASEGTGLGLVISRQLARLMGGDVMAYSQVGEGSTFSLTIRCETPAADFIYPSVEQETLNEVATLVVKLNSKVLVVEDNLVLQKLTMKQLETLGIDVQAASDGVTALALTESQKFDLILMDVHLPGVDGYRVALAIRNREAGTDRHVPIVAMTAAASADDRDGCLRAGMDDFLRKPVRMQDILQVMRRWLISPSNYPKPIS